MTFECSYTIAKISHHVLSKMDTLTGNNGKASYQPLTFQDYNLTDLVSLVLLVYMAPRGLIPL